MTNSSNHDDSEIQLWRQVSTSVPVVGSCLTPTDLAGYLDGRISAGQIVHIEAHLADCSACLASIRELRSILAEQAESHVLVSSEVIARAQSLVAAQSPEKIPLESHWSFAAWWPLLRYPTAAAAAIAISIVGYRTGSVAIASTEPESIEFAAEISFGLYVYDSDNDDSILAALLTENGEVLQ